MKLNEVVEGKIYAAKISGRLVPVKIVRIAKKSIPSYDQFAGRITYRETTRMAGVNMITKREVTIKSAVKLRFEVSKGSDGRYAKV